jgi:hypothetical protein
MHQPRTGWLVRIRGRFEGFLSIRCAGCRPFKRCVNAAGGARGAEQLLEFPGGLRIRAAFQNQASAERGLVKSLGGLGVDALEAGDYFFMDRRILWIISQYDSIAGISHQFSFKTAAMPWASASLGACGKPYQSKNQFVVPVGEYKIFIIEPQGLVKAQMKIQRRMNRPLNAALFIYRQVFSIGPVIFYDWN